MDKRLMRTWGWSPGKSQNARVRNSIETTALLMDKMFWHQRGHCAICGGGPMCSSTSSDPKKHFLHADHDHKSREFRGWLCFFCNSGVLPSFYMRKTIPPALYRAVVNYLDTSLKVKLEKPFVRRDLRRVSALHAKEASKKRRRSKRRNAE